MTQKLSKHRWMDPRKDWGQNRGLQGAGGQGNSGKTGNLHLQKGELPTFSLYCFLMRRWVSQGQGSLQMSMMQSNNQTQKKTYYDYWQRGQPLALAVG